jgi:hypothetical protein
MRPIAVRWTVPCWTEAGLCYPTCAVESGSNCMRVAAVRGRWATRHPARPTASALAQQKEWGETRAWRRTVFRIRNWTSLLFISLCREIAVSNAALRMQLKTARGTGCFQNWMYVLVVIMVQFRVVNLWIKRGKYCTVAKFACRVKEFC